MYINIDFVLFSANVQFIVNSQRKDENCNDKAVPRLLSDNIQKSFKGIFPSEPDAGRGSRAKQDNESLRDLVNNLTNLALAITEDREGGREEEKEVEDEEEEVDTQVYERKFESLEKKLKRTNLMRRRESQALLVGLRKTRSSSGIVNSKPL